MRIAFIGAGELAEPYLAALRRRSGVELTAVCDSDRRAAEQVAAGWSARVFLDYASMLSEAEPQAVWICMGPAQQGDIVLQCAQRRIPFFAVPPGCLDFERARVAGRVLAGQSLVTAVGYPARHSDIVREAREFLGDEPAPLLAGCWLGSADDGELETGLRTIWTKASALIDTMRHFNGDVARIWAVSTGSAEDGLKAQLQFKNGTAATLTCASFAGQEPRQELELVSEKGSLTLTGGLATLRLEEADKTTILRALNNAAEDMALAFLQAVEAGDPEAVGPSYADALRTLAICRAAAISVEEKRVVEVTELLAP